MLVKSTVIDTIKKFPENFSIDDLIEKLVVLERIEEGNKQSVENNVISDEALDIEIEKWFK